jgi:hypothetical protein
MLVAPKPTEPREPETFGRVLPFPQRRPPKPHLAASTQQPKDHEAEFADDLARYEREPEEPIDYRQRTLMNIIAAAIVMLLIGAGVWIADAIGTMEKDQDCAMQGRANCAPIELPPPNQ